MSSFAETYKNIENDFYQTKVTFAETFAWILSQITEEEDPEFYASIKRVIQLLDIAAPAKRDAKSITTFGNSLEKDIERAKSAYTGRIRLENKNYLFDPEYPLTDLGQIQEIFLEAATHIQKFREKLANEQAAA